MKQLLVLLLSVGALSSQAKINSTKVIYGEDNREDVMNVTNAMYLELSESTAAMISRHSISDNGDGTVRLKGDSLASRGICKSERFSEQPSVANCSGFLVGKDLLVTAGHCIRSYADCRKYRWVFDYKISHEGQTQINVSKGKVYNCKEVINTVLSRTDSNDFALIRLDSDVTDRRVLDIRRRGRITKGENLVVIGHPSGLPTKVADGAYVKSLSSKYFSANLDTYGGNSGSAVFNAKTGLVEGILVRGATDYLYDRSAGCRVSNVLSNDAGKGEDVTYITNIPELQTY